MTLKELREMDCDYLKPKEVAAILHCRQDAVTECSKAGILPFPYFRSGNRTKIPRLAFIKWMEGGLESGTVA